MNASLLDKKIDYWEHQLLDLGKRNRMIHYRDTKRTTLKFLEPSFEELYRRLAVEEETLTFQRAVDRETDVRVFSILSLLETLSSPLPVNIGDIKTEDTALERQKTLKHMRAKARLSMEEQGTNILYLCFGFIEWKDGKGASAQWLRSPLILMPATLSLETLHSPYTLSKHEDDIVLNPTLAYYLKTEYGIELPAFDADKDTLEGFFKQLESVADKNGWRIIREVSLGLLSFLKITMYNDLIQNETRIRQNPVIRAMSGDTEEANTIPEELFTSDPDAVSTQDCYQVMSADSSQQDAILYSKNKISFVMQGPPGTGKSQTITNIIAEALADGKKVLFVSEKMSALQVVYKRLQDAHLADFCLPLHSYKANKLDILQQIGANLKLKQTRVKDTALHNLEELLSIRKELNQYASELHQLRDELKLSCYDIYGKLEELCDAPTLVFDFPNILSASQSRLQELSRRLKEYSLALERMQYQISGHPWEGLISRTSGYRDTERMKKMLSLAIETLSSLIDSMKAVEENPALAETVSFDKIPALADLLLKITRLPDVPLHWFEEASTELIRNEAKTAKTKYEKLFALETAIKSVFNDGIFGFDYNEWQQELFQIARKLAPLPLMKKKAALFFIQNRKALAETFFDLKDSLTQAKAAFQKANDTLGFSLKPNTFHQKQLSEMLSWLEGNVILPLDWFDKDLRGVKMLIAEGKTRAERLIERKEYILTDWEPEILDLDYAPILVRYKTEYTGFSKIFNSQYGKDKKQLLALSRNILKKITDEQAADILSALKQYHEQLDWFEENRETLAISLGFYDNSVHSDWDKALLAAETVEKLRTLPALYSSDKMKALLSQSHWEMLDELRETCRLADNAFTRAQNISSEYGFDLSVEKVGFDGNEALLIVSQYAEGLASLVSQYDTISPYLISSETAFDDISLVLDGLNAHQELCAELSQDLTARQNTFGALFHERETDWGHILLLIDQTQDIREHPLFSVLTPFLTASADRKRTLEKTAEEWQMRFAKAETPFKEIALQFTEQTFHIPVLSAKDKLQNCLTHIDRMEERVDYLETKDACAETELSDFIETFERSEHLCEAESIFLKGFYRMWLDAACEQSASVRRFRRNVQDERIEKFIELDDLQLSIAQMRIREKLIEALPSHHQLLKATDEVAILNKELNKKRNIMPLRKLFRLIPNLLLTLKPCLMMSPLSVSYFLETEAYHFDLVIFDEASQIFPEDAIGAIFRGSQVIIAGDSKQLPPTNFFAANTSSFENETNQDEDDYSEVVSDSILEETASVLPNRTLLWHYRSKHEALIAFSNQEIYQNHLITFPSHIARADDMGVEYVYVADGYYEGNGKNCNILEAEKCVELVTEHIRKYPHRSLGIIAFSEKQQSAIENKIIDFRERNPQYEWFFSETKEEPFFVKNLENVQGDERDTIIFSICYAKDRHGKMYMRFGPLGINGGERRLNVAITRAKCNIKLVGSILPSDIDLEKTNSEGVRLLRSYIEFAQKGDIALRPAEKTDALEAEDDFCKTISAFLEKNGYQIQTGVGCSDYKIDIAVLHPEKEGVFFAGIECDGPSYVRAKTARDRDHLRKSVLEGMGWKLYRVWSTEWSRHRAEEETALLEFLKETLENHPQDPSKTMDDTEQCPVALEEIASEAERTEKPEETKNPYGFAYYQEIPLTSLKTGLTKNDLADIGENVLRIVSEEQPIHAELLYKRLAPAFSNGKVTESLKKAIDRAISSRLMEKVGMEEDRFLHLIPHEPVHARIPSANTLPRPMEYIHTQEVADAMLTIASHSFGITIEDLTAECIRAFGFERKGPKIKQKTDAALQYLIEADMLRVIDGKAVVSASYK